MDAAKQLLDETGDDKAVTLRAVARRAGIAAPSIYAHFADRQLILLAVVQEAFEELQQLLLATEAGAGPDPAERLRAVSRAYLDFARTRPQRYRVMFGGLWAATEAVEEAAVAPGDVTALGQEALMVFVRALQECATSGRSASDDPAADSVALWVGLHGLAHQRAAAPLFPWPEDVAGRLVDHLAQLRPDTPEKTSRL